MKANLPVPKAHVEAEPILTCRMSVRNHPVPPWAALYWSYNPGALIGQTLRDRYYKSKETMRKLFDSMNDSAAENNPREARRTRRSVRPGWRQSAVNLELRTRAGQTDLVNGSAAKGMSAATSDKCQQTKSPPPHHCRPELDTSLLFPK